MKTPNKILEIKDITKAYKKDDNSVLALDHITIDLGQGKSMALVGPSGSGKTTLLQLIGGLDKPTSGTVKVNGHDLSQFNDTELSHFRNRTIGFVFQFFNLQNYYTAVENVALPLIIKGEKEKIAYSKAQALLKQVGLEKRFYHYPSEMSGGEMQRVAIARSLTNDPALILADEPTGNLDKNSALQVLDLFDEIRDRGVSLIISTHDERVSKRYKQIVILENGRIKPAN